MLKYILKRLLLLIPVIIGISFIIFSIMQLTPGDPAREILGDNAAQEAVDALREEMGLNDPFLLQYGRYMWKAVRGDFGTSYQTGQSVMKQILERFPTTIYLAIGATLVAIIIGVPVGLISAVKQYSLMDDISTIFSMVLTAIPNFWLGLVLMLALSLKLKWFPAYGATSLKHFVLPWITLSCMTLAVLIRMTRSSMLEVIRQDYIRTARAKGARERRIVFRHALRNALLPVITVIGTQLSVQLGGAIIVETVFSIPGLGTMIISGIKTKDIPVVMGGVMFIALVGGLVNLLVDILYAYIDPRLKSRYVGTKRTKKQLNQPEKEVAGDA
ncbi:MAG: ABC transporter permease [Clostridia bacterium]|nr:ABC transporter permease [Clostridia bacterium]